MKHVPTIKERDKALITDLVRRFGPISRAQLHSLTDFRPATIGTVLSELMDEGLLVKAGLSDNPKGRKQILIQMNAGFGFVITLDYDAELVSAGVMDLCGVLQAPVLREATDLQHGADGLLAQLKAIVGRAVDEAGAGAGQLLGIGIGDPGVVNSRDGISVFSSTIDFWKDIRLKELFEEEFEVPVTVSDNTRTKAIAERSLGAGNNSTDMIYVEYGAGIGAGIFADGRLLGGHRWSAGEFGHTATTEGGPPCKCGSFGCLEAVAGLGALEMKIRSALREGGYSRGLELAGGDLDGITGWHVLECSAVGDKMSSVLVEEVARSLGFGIANLVNMFNPEVIVLDQRLQIAGVQFMEQIVRAVKMRALAYATEELTFCFGTLGANAGLLGAGLLILESIFAVPALKQPKFLLESDEPFVSTIA